MSTSEEPPSTIEAVANTSLSRRKVLGGIAAGTVAFLSPMGRMAGAAPSATTAGTERGQSDRRYQRGPKGVGQVGGPALGFTALGPFQDDEVHVPTGYASQVLIPWGDPINPGGPAFEFDGTNTAADQLQQLGMGHDGMHFFPLSADRGLLVVNHEAVDNTVMFDAEPDWTDLEVVRRHQYAHGVAVVEVQRQGSTWVHVPSKYARRITPLTEMDVTGPAAAALGGTAQGTFNNCANGKTPWGTYLTCEENFNGYFGSDTAPTTTDPTWSRYGIAPGGAISNPWYKADKRFDLSVTPDEPRRHGWVVEIDPMDPTSRPKKRTALGRMKHENAEFAEAADGRAVVYTGDDERFYHLYKFVSERPWRDMIAAGESPLDKGTLFVARFDADGTGTWLPLTVGNVPGFAIIADILINARGAARAVDATQMDRPEWVAVHPTLAGVAYGTFTNNSQRALTSTNPERDPVDHVNPRATNTHGHIIRWQNSGGDHAATGFVWSMFALAGKGLGTGDGSTIAPADAFGSPDGLAFDADGRLWIQTDGGQPTVQGQACNNQMLAADPETGDIRRFLVGPMGCEITGWTMTPERTTLFINIQHPGEVTGYGAPAGQSNWPDKKGRPRSATVAIRRLDGGVIGAA